MVFGTNQPTKNLLPLIQPPTSQLTNVSNNYSNNQFESERDRRIRLREM